MLRWLLILTMALLPWHGWAGASAAAFERTAQPAAAHVAAALVDHAAHPGHASADCLDDAGAAAGHHAEAAAEGGCPGCSMCHSCSPVGLPAMAAVPRADGDLPQRPDAVVTRFASADRDPGLKPPIS